MCFDNAAAVFVITVGQRICTFMANFLEDFLSARLLFSEILWIDKLLFFMKEFIS